MPDETPIPGHASGFHQDPVLGMIQTALNDLKIGQANQAKSIGKLHEKVNTSTVTIAKVEGKLDQFVTKEQFGAHEEEALTRCLRMHGASAIDPSKKKTTARSKTQAGPWWAALLQGPMPYVLVILVLVLIIVVIATGLPADHFIPHSGGGNP